MADGGPSVLPTGAVTLVFTDMEGSTRLLHELGEEFGELLDTHDRLLREVWKQHGGVEIKTEGDAFLVAFSETPNAVTAVAAAQRGLAEQPWPAGHEVRVRMSVHLGTPKLYGRDYWGIDVNYAARLCTAANGGQVLLSETAAAAVDADLEDLGLHALKDFPSPRRIFQLRIDGRGSEHFPALRSLRAGRTNLPDQISTLVGRGEEVAQIAELLDAHRLVTLAGSGGVGKTRLAMEVGARLLDGSGDGVWAVELAGLADERRVPNAVAGALGLRLQADGDLADELAGQLADHRMLLVLDNCEHLIEPAARLTEILLRRCPGLSVLVTSREPLRLHGERVYRVPSLSLPPGDLEGADAALKYDGVRLFVERATSHRARFRLDDSAVTDVVAVVRRLDGIPLAIELAAPWLARLSVAELRQRLDRGFALLADGQRTALARQRTIAALIDWSFDGLPGPEQRLLAELSVFAGGFDLAAAEAVCAAIFGDDVVIHLGALVDKSLVQADDVTGELRYRLLETVRAYAAEKLQAMGEYAADRASAAHMSHYLRMAEAFDMEVDRRRIPDWLVRLRRDRDNLRAAVARARADPDPGFALRLAATLARLWIDGGNASEGLADLDEALSRPSAADGTRARALVCRSSLWAYQRGADVTSARLADAEEALAIARRLGDDLVALRALHYRTYLAMRGGDLIEALSAAEQGIALVTQETPLEMVCRIYRAKAAVELNAGADPRASLSQALAAAHRCGEVVEAMRVQGQLGYALMARGENAVARQTMTAAAGAARDLGMESDALHVTLNLGYAILADGDLDEALEHEIAVLEAAESIAAEEVKYYALVCIALTRSALGERELAATLHGAVEAELARRGDQLETFEADLRDADLTRLRNELGEPAFDTCYRRGVAMQFDDALALARGEPSPNT